MTMKITARLAVLLLAIIPLALHAEGSSTWYINPAIGWQTFDSNRNLDDDRLFELGLEHRYGKHWAAELRFNETDTDYDNMSGDVDANQYALDGIYYFCNCNENSTFEPFAVLGAGHGKFDDDSNTENETQFNAGAGFRISLNDNVTVRTVLRGVYGHDDSTLDSVLTVGLSYAIGARPKPMPAARAPIMDSDGDGVPDNLDRCRSTPSGASVNAKGCPLDTDGDGVADYLDSCLNTPAGRAVDDKGCKLVLMRTEQISLTVNFALNSAVVPDESLSEIERVALFMRKYGTAMADIEGHTDSSGRAPYNKSLSQRRADAVKAVLVERYSIDASRLSATGYGEEQPVADESTAEGRKANRRVVAVFKAEVEE